MTLIAPDADFTGDAMEDLYRHLRAQYKNVFSEEAIEIHVRDYVGMTFAESVVGLVEGAIPVGGRVLDIGSGFGSFVLAARNRGLDAAGVEIESYEVAFARRRLSVTRPQDEPERVYRQLDAKQLQEQNSNFDAITLWNVLEHIDDYKRVIQTVADLLKPDGALFVICPNYAAFRVEAHYRVPWIPFLPRKIASLYLRALGRDPGFFETSIFYRTNWGVMASLINSGFRLYDFTAMQTMMPERQALRRMIRHPGRFLTYYNPFKESVVLAARKRGR